MLVVYNELIAACVLGVAWRSLVTKNVLAGLGLALTFPFLVSCGGSSSQPTSPVVVAPSPTPVPTPTPLALSAIPPCQLPPSNPSSTSWCTTCRPNLGEAVNAAIDRVLIERPDLFNVDDVNGGPRILDYDRYMTAVVSALNQTGMCGRIDPEGEIGVKSSDSFSEQWLIASRAGWSPPSGNWVWRKFRGRETPASF